MTSRTILLACELGSGQRQADRFLPIAAGLASAGHRITIAMPQGMPVLSRITAAGFLVVDAPVWRAEPPPGFIANTFADILLHSGYATPDALGGLLAGWLGLLRATSPALVVADFAPTALLACRMAGVPYVLLGDGFTLPPATDPLPPMRPWADGPPPNLHGTEGRLLAAINVALRAEGGTPLGRLCDLFAGAQDHLLCTFPELDHYQGRGEAMYFGEVFAPSTGRPAIWPTGTAERAYVAVSPGLKAFRSVVAALARLGLPAIVTAPGLSANEAAALTGPTTHVVADPPDRDATLAQCDFVIGQDIGIAAPALLASRPVLLVPHAVEQMMTLHRIAPQGLGHGLPPDATTEMADQAVRRLLDDSACRLRVANFARHYAGYRPVLATDAIVEACLDLPSLTGS